MELQTSKQLSSGYLNHSNSHVIEDYPDGYLKLKADALFEVREQLLKQPINPVFKEFIIKSLRQTKGNVCIEHKVNSTMDKDDPDKRFGSIINLDPLNIGKKLNTYLKLSNTKLMENGVLIGYINIKFPFFESIKKSMKDSIRKPNTNLAINLFFPPIKLKFSNMSKAEFFGRLSCFGFEISDAAAYKDKLYFVAEKKRDPLYSKKRQNGLFIKLPRIGKNGKIKYFYKIRTMYPYAEYLQEYLCRVQGLQTGGKINGDFRISKFGKFLRKYWIDEIPMIINLLKGDVKLFGVRPLSEHYFNLYTEELKNLRTKTKPGLIPPFYVDFPKTLDEIMESETKYLKEYGENPVLTDIKYLLKALINIFFNGYRSK